MDCISYIEDLRIEIKVLNELKDCENSKKDEIVEKIQKKEKTLATVMRNLEKLSGNEIEYKLYLYILNGYSITKAIERVAEYNYKHDIIPSSNTTLWRRYKKMKEILKL